MVLPSWVTVMCRQKICHYCRIVLYDTPPLIFRFISMCLALLLGTTMCSIICWRVQVNLSVRICHSLNHKTTITSTKADAMSWRTSAWRRQQMRRMSSCDCSSPWRWLASPRTLSEGDSLAPHIFGSFCHLSVWHMSICPVLVCSCRVFCVLSAVLHLGNIQFKKVRGIPHGGLSLGCFSLDRMFLTCFHHSTETFTSPP